MADTSLTPINRFRIPTVLVLLVLFAGCSGILGPPAGSTPPASPSQPSTSTSTVSPSDSQSSPAPETDGPVETAVPQFDQTTETSGIVLRLSDLPSEYSLSGETILRRDKISGEEQERLEERRVLVQHSRSFTQTSSSEKPRIVFSEATIFETNGAGQERLEEIVTTFDESGATIERVEIASGVGVTKITYETDRGTKNVALYYRRGNMLVSVIVSHPTSYKDTTATDFFIELLGDIPSQE